MTNPGKNTSKIAQIKEKREEKFCFKIVKDMVK